VSFALSVFDLVWLDSLGDEDDESVLFGVEAIMETSRKSLVARVDWLSWFREGFKVER
jgi:hypothetical protein